jgi:hypothetical protein
VEKKKTNLIGGSQWNTSVGNSEDFIRLQTSRQACTLYSQRSAARQQRCSKITKKATTVKTTVIQNKKLRDCLMHAELLAGRHFGAEGAAWVLALAPNS